MIIIISNYDYGILIVLYFNKKQYAEFMIDIIYIYFFCIYKLLFALSKSLLTIAKLMW